MTPERRIIAAAVDRLRHYVSSGGRPYLAPGGKLCLGPRAPGQWRQGGPEAQAKRESADAAFFSALRHDGGNRCMTRAVQIAGTRLPSGYIVMDGA